MGVGVWGNWSSENYGKLDTLRITSSESETNFETFVPEEYLLRKINRHIKFCFIDLLKNVYYLNNSRPSIDLVILIKISLFNIFLVLQVWTKQFNIFSKYCLWIVSSSSFA